MQKGTSSIKTLQMQALSSILPYPFLKCDEFSPVSTKINLNLKDETQIHDDNEEKVDEQQEFNFAQVNPQETLLFADEIFDNGQIRPTYPCFHHSFIYTNKDDNVTLPLRSPLKKLFVEKVDNFPPRLTRDYNNHETSQQTTVVEMKASNDKWKKSNSTGFSKMWRLRHDLKRRSKSEGKDAFVFLDPSMPMSNCSKKRKEENFVLKKVKGEDCKTTFSAHEKLYVRNRKRNENNKRKSFLPYKQNLIGFFTNVNGFSRNLHPF